MKTDLEDLVRNYLHQGQLLHLSTQSNEGLWMCHVWYAIGSDYKELIWTSNYSRRHSKEIRHNTAVAGGVVAIELDGLGQDVRGLSFQGQAEELTGDNVIDAYDHYAERRPNVRDMFSPADIQAGETDNRMYKVDVKRFALWDEVNYPQDPKQELTF